MVPLKQKGQVCLSACKTYAFEEVRAALREQLDALHVEELLFPGCRVVIKPNLVIRSKPEEGVITHPAVVAAVAVELLERGAGHVTVAESPEGLIRRRFCERSTRQADIRSWPKHMDFP